MTAKPRPKPKPLPRPIAPADFIEKYAPEVREMAGDMADIDFSFKQDAVVIHDLRKPAAIRRGILFTSVEIRSGAHDSLGEIERRVSEFMNKG